MTDDEREPKEPTDEELRIKVASYTIEELDKRTRGSADSTVLTLTDLSCQAIRTAHFVSQSGIFYPWQIRQLISYLMKIQQEVESDIRQYKAAVDEAAKRGVQ